MTANLFSCIKCCLSKRARTTSEKFLKAQEVLDGDLDIRNIVKVKSAVMVLSNLILKNKFQKQLFFGQRQHFLNLNTESEPESDDMDKGGENFGADNLSAIASQLVNKEYKTPFERRLLLGLMSRDYSLYDDINKTPVDPEDTRGYISLVDSKTPGQVTG